MRVYEAFAVPHLNGVRNPGGRRPPHQRGIFPTVRPPPVMQHNALDYMQIVGQCPEMAVPRANQGTRATLALLPARAAREIFGMRATRATRATRAAWARQSTHSSA